MAGTERKSFAFTPTKVYPSGSATIDWKSKATKCVERLYTNGSDSRQEKNGKPNSLVEKLLKPADIRTCGLFSKLSKDDQLIIDRKDSDERDTDKFKKRIAKFILECEKKQEKDESLFVKLSEEGRYILQLLAETSHDSIDKTWVAKIKKKFVIRSIFENQERQKVLQK